MTADSFVDLLISLLDSSQGKDARLASTFPLCRSNACLAGFTARADLHLSERHRFQQAARKMQAFVPVTTGVRMAQELKISRCAED